MHMMQMHWALKRDPSRVKPRSKRRPLEEAVAAGTYDPFVKEQRHLRKGVGKPPPTMLYFSDSQPQPKAEQRVAASAPSSPPSILPDAPAIQDAVDLLSLARPVASTAQPKKAQRPHPYARPARAATPEEPAGTEPPSPNPAPVPTLTAQKSEICFNEEMIREMSVLAQNATAAGSLASLCFSDASPSVPSIPTAAAPAALANDSYAQDVLAQRLALPATAQPSASPPVPSVSPPSAAAAARVQSLPTCTSGGG